MKDVTHLVNFGEVDSECLPLQNCVCGERFDYWKEILGIYENRPWVCPRCGVRLIFRNDIRVFEL